MHCYENPIYVLPEKELSGLSPNFHILVSVSNLYIPWIGPHIFPQYLFRIFGIVPLQCALLVPIKKLLNA
jgi:hypothetical protein